ncbi:MAG: HEAT repeat domain-containing protein [Planctomycetaceae bacterium]|jgi:HEAT repeat protein|nr:HEAT repeat domain-containing protein [Planctomycetaceae bacterium]
MRKLFFFVFIFIAFFVSAQETPQDETTKLTTVLQDPNASHYAKTLACKLAGQSGSEASVAPLAAVLLDEKLSHPARIGLQQIPGSAATVALCTAASQAKGSILIGIIGSLGDRRDPAAVTALTQLLAEPDSQVVRASAIALGKIGNAEALQALQKRFSETEITQKVLLVDGLFACAEHLKAMGNDKEAATVYAVVRVQKELPVSSRCGAIRGEILSLGLNAVSVLNTEMSGSADAEFLAALEASRDLTAPELTPVFLDILPKLNTERKILLLDLLDCRSDPKTKDTILDMAKNEQNTEVRNAAIRALAGFPYEDVIAYLLEQVADEKNTLFFDSIIDALTRMSADELNTKIIEHLKITKGKACIPLVRICAQRKITASTPVLLPFLTDPEYDVRVVVLQALGNTVSGENIDVLIERLLKPSSKIEFDTVIGSLHVVCNRTVDCEAVAGKLAAVYDSAPIETKTVLLDLFGALGGQTAIVAVRKAIADPTEAIQDAATRVLGNWHDPDAAPVILEILQNPAAQKFHNRSLRGYIRIVRQMDTSNEHRFNMCLEAMKFVQRNEEQLLLIDALGRIPIPQSLEKLQEFLDNPVLAEPASLSAIAVGKAILTQQREKVAAVMQKILNITKNDETRRQTNEILENTKE